LKTSGILQFQTTVFCLVSTIVVIILHTVYGVITFYILCVGVGRMLVNVELSFVKADLSVLLTQYCAGGKSETNEMGRACGAYGGG
jgi:hypothetical protein